MGCKGECIIMGKSYKKKGKTEVYPFWYMEDIKNMMNYFKERGMWHWYLAFNLGLLLGRRVGDTLSFLWSDFFYDNGRMKDEMDIEEHKTGKETRPYICEACKDAIRLYIKMTGVSPMEHLNEYVLPTDKKAELLLHKDEYTEEEYDELFYEATKIQAGAFRKQFKLAAKASDIQYPVSTHSLRKAFGYWSVKLHPYDVTTVDKLQGIFAHSDRNTTLRYIGIEREGEIQLYNDMGNFVSDIIAGKKPIIKNSPVIPLKSEDFRDLLSKLWDMAVSGMDKFDGINKIIGMAEKFMV